MMSFKSGLRAFAVSAAIAALTFAAPAADAARMGGGGMHGGGFHGGGFHGFRGFRGCCWRGGVFVGGWPWWGGWYGYPYYPAYYPYPYYYGGYPDYGSDYDQDDDYGSSGQAPPQNYSAAPSGGAY